MSVSNSYGDVCRACMKKDNDMKCIFNSEVNSVPVSQMLSFATPLMIRPDDGLPNTLCSNCLQMLISFYKFQQMCIESDQKFRISRSAAGSNQVSVTKANNQTQQKVILKCPPPKLRPPPPPPDDYMTHKGRVQLDWNSYEPLPIVEVSDEEDVVLKFECDNDILVATEEDDPSDIDVIDEYEQFDKLPIIDVRIDDKPTISKSGGATKSSDDEEVVLFTINASIPTAVDTFECKMCGLGFDRQDGLDRHVKTHFPTEVQSNTISSPSNPVVKSSAPAKLAYICTICKMAFGGQDRLAMHKKTHDKQGLTRNELTQQNRNSYSFECKTCEKFYNNQESYDRHSCVPVIHSSNGTLSKHPSFEEKRLYTCNICKKAFQTWEELTKHISEHQIKILYGSDPGSNTTVNVNVNIQTDKSHECEVCHKSFSSWEDIKVHWQQHSDNQKANLTSHNNAITVSTSSEIKPVIHATITPEEASKESPKLSAEDNVKVYSQHACNICGKLFSHFLNLKHHMRIKHKKKVNPQDSSQLEELKPVDALRAYRILRLYECGTCGKTFERQGHLLRHKKTHRKKSSSVQNTNCEPSEPEVDKRCQCELCGIFVAHEANLRRHMKRIHEMGDELNREEEKGISVSENEEPFACIVCEEEFISRRALVQHLTKHKKEKENEQRIAEEEEQAEEAEDEIVEEDGEEDPNRMMTRGNVMDREKPFVCSCGKRFKKVGHRDQHKLLHDFQTDCQAGPISCEVCKREFKTASHLKQHMIKHKLFKCSICGEKFARNHNLEIHMKTHCGSKKVSKSDMLRCDVCKKKFTTKNCKIRHLKLLHGINISYTDDPESRVLYNCVGCSKSFSHPDNLAEHKKCHSGMKKEHAAKEGTPQKEAEKEKKTGTSVLPYNDPHKCLECRLVVSTRGCLKKHMARKHKKCYYPINPKKYAVQCACTRPFDNSASLLKHIRAHIVKPGSAVRYACHFCFIDRLHAWQIRRHLKDSHAVTLEELETVSWKLCTICNTNFMNAVELKRHIKMKHGKKDKISTKTVYKCKTCSKCYLAKNLMLKHMKSHRSKGTEEERANDFSEEKWPICQSCNKAFPKASKVRSHMERVHNIKVKEEDLVEEEKN